MDPVEIWEVIGVSVRTTDYETAWDERETTGVAFVVGDTGEPAMLIESLANWTMRPRGKTDYGDVGAILAGRRNPEAVHVKLTLQAWFVQVWWPRLPAVDACHHEGLIFNGDNRADPVRGDELAPADRALGLAWHGQITW